MYNQMGIKWGTLNRLECKSHSTSRFGGGKDGNKRETAFYVPGAEALLYAV